jgi:hypothetical protein
LTSERLGKIERVVAAGGVDLSTLVDKPSERFERSARGDISPIFSSMFTPLLSSKRPSEHIVCHEGSAEKVKIRFAAWD